MRTRRRVARSIVTLALVAAMSSSPSRAEAPDRRTIGPMIKAGNSDAVPILLRRLAEVAAEPLDPARGRTEGLTEVLNAVGDCSMYGLDEAGPQMVRAYRAMPGPTVGSLPSLVRSASRYHSAAARAFQWTLLDDPRVADDFQRTLLLAALAAGGDDRAVEALGAFVETQLSRLSLGEGASGTLEQAIPRTPSPALRERIGRIAPIGDEAADRALAKLKERMSFYAKSPAELMDRIEHASPAGTTEASDALAMLGSVGTPADLPRLIALPLGQRGAVRDERRLGVERDAAVASIRRNHWRELLAPASTAATPTAPPTSRSTTTEASE